MKSGQIKLYNLFKKELNLADDKAAAFVAAVEEVVGHEFRNEKQTLSTKEDIQTVKDKLLLNFYQPQRGNIFLDETELFKINPEQWRRQCGIVLQDGYIFSGTIGENIALGDTDPDKNRLWEAANVACLNDFTEKLPMKFDTKIGGTGTGISGGQKQRILIAKAVYQNPKFIFFDEATSNLDSNNERKIMRNLASFFINKTVIIIAHRLSTVKRADQIIVLEDGHIKEVGTHESLITNKYKYFDLIRDQLEL